MSRVSNCTFWVSFIYKCTLQKSFFLHNLQCPSVFSELGKVFLIPSQQIQNVLLGTFPLSFLSSLDSLIRSVSGLLSLEYRVVSRSCFFLNLFTVVNISKPILIVREFYRRSSKFTVSFPSLNVNINESQFFLFDFKG